MQNPVQTERSIERLVQRMLWAVDRLDWPSIRGAFAARVRVDYTSLFGGEAQDVAADELLAGWRTLLPGFDATQHITGPVIVTLTGDGAATAETHVRGYHHIAGDRSGAIAGAQGGTWMVAGHYVMGVRRENEDWRIAAITLQSFWQEGRLDLAKLATERVEAGHSRR